MRSSEGTGFGGASSSRRPRPAPLASDGAGE